jgi:hypothetical protein
VTALARVFDGRLDPPVPTHEAADDLWCRLVAEGRLVDRLDDGERDRAYRVNLCSWGSDADLMGPVGSTGDRRAPDGTTKGPHRVSRRRFIPSRVHGGHRPVRSRLRPTRRS